MLFFTFLLCGFASSAANRSFDPLTLALAQDFGVPAATAGLLASAAFLPYALMQPVFGPVGDHFGKDRVIKFALWTVALMTLACAFAPAFWMLLVLRIFGGAAAGGIVPVTQALIGDLVKPAERQVTIARFTISMIVGQMGGAALGGMLEGLIGWRNVILGAGVITLVSAYMASRNIPTYKTSGGSKFSFARAAANYRTIFRNPRAWVCYSTTPIVSGLSFGLLPFISPILQIQQNGVVREAGFLIAAQGAGSMGLSLIVPYMLRLMSRNALIVGGSLLLAASLVLFSMAWHWTILIAVFFLFGFGWFMQHNSFQYEVSEISQEFRGSAYSMHAFFFFIGQFMGPVIYSQVIPRFGPKPALIGAAIAIALSGCMSAVFFNWIARRERA